MAGAEKFRNVSLACAVGSTLLFWSVYLDNQSVGAERRAALARTTMPLPLNGFSTSLRGVLPITARANRVDAQDVGKPQLLVVVSDTCPGSRLAVPEWLAWIRSWPSRGYSAVVVSVEGTNHLSQLADAFASRGVATQTLRVTQRQDFSLSSGVTGTPTLLAIDSGGRVRLVGTGSSKSIQRVVGEFLHTEGVH